MHPWCTANATSCATYIASPHAPEYFFSFFCANTEQSVVPAELPLPPPPCPKVVPFGIKDAKHLRRAYPVLRHGHEKADACRQTVLRLGDQDAEQAMVTQDITDLDYDPCSRSEASSSVEEKVGSSFRCL